jgi:ATP-dependent Clp protease adaptor protein ClpS
MPDRRTKTDSDTLVQERIRTQKPKMFRVLLINDDYTTMDFVVHVLVTVFLKSPSEATQIMLQVHRVGKGVAGIFSKQIAEAKIEQVHQRARSQGHPLRCDMEEA